MTENQALTETFTGRLTSEDIDVVHFHLNTILYLYIPAIIFRKKINFIHTLHSVTSKTIGFKYSVGKAQHQVSNQTS